MNKPFSASAVSGAIARNAASYDDLPYESHAFAQTQPSRLAALAHLFGLAAPLARTARVLEIGCASGGNLIPLAVRNPNARFEGIDLSARQIAEGQARIARLGLTNIRLRQLSLTEIGRREGTFDYILCHGVYSWVPAPVRKSILRIARENLSPTGIAFVSYNVLPGWRLRQTLRDALALHVPAAGSLRARVAEARKLLVFLAEHTPANTTWGTIFRNEAAQLAGMSDSYIGHEFLEDCNEPCSFSEFLNDAGAQGLGYLAEADLVTMLPENMNPAAAAVLRTLAGNQLVPLEQHIDVFTGRTFRQTLLVHAPQAAQCVRTLLPAQADGLHFIAPLDFAFAGDENGQAVFTTGAGARFATGDMAVRVAVQALASRLPASSSLDDLVAATTSKGLDANRDAIATALFQMMTVGMLQPSTEPVVAAAVLSDKPVACPALRSDLAAGQISSTNLQHQRVDFDIVAQVVVPRLDGTNDREALIAIVREAEAAGTVTFMRNGEKVVDAEGVAACAAEHVDRVLAHCVQRACLIG